MIAVVTYKMRQDWKPWTLIFPCNFSHLFDPKVGEYRILYYNPKNIPLEDIRTSLFVGTKSTGDFSGATSAVLDTNLPLSQYAAGQWTLIEKYNCLWISFAIYSYLKHKEKYA